MPGIMRWRRPVTDWVRANGLLAMLLLISATLNVLLSARVQQITRAAERARADTRLSVGTPLKAFTAIDPKGNSISIDPRSPDGRMTVFYVFTPPCGWCKRNVDSSNALYEQTRDRVRFVGLSLSEQNLVDYLASNAIAYPVLTRLPSEVVIDYRLGGTPQTIVVASDGRVLKNWMGAFQNSNRSEIQSFLNVQLPALATDKSAQ